MAAVLLLASQTSNAFIVFDPTNWAANYASSIAAIKNEITTDSQYITQLQQYIVQLQNVRQMGGVGDAVRLAGFQSELSTMQQLASANQNLYASLQNGSNYVQGISKMINVSGTTPEAWLAREKSLVAQNDGIATNLMQVGQASVDSVSQAQQQRAQILSDNDINEGIRGTAMKTNVMLGNLASLNSTQIALMKANNDAVAQKMKIQDDLNQRNDSEAKSWINNRIRIQEQNSKLGQQQ